MESHFENACREGIVPGIVLSARSKSGEFAYTWCHGNRSVKTETGPLKPDTLLRIYSGSKLIVSVCAMQCVERGLINLDDNISKFVPELQNVQLLKGFGEDNQPLLEQPRNDITLRRLLTHSSGFSYPVFSPLLQQWHKQQDKPLFSNHPKLVDQYAFPLDFEPGTKWTYSPSIDWVGRLIEHLTGQTLEQYMQENVCKPLGLTKTTFFPQQHKELLEGHARIAIRNEITGVLEDKSVTYWDQDPIDCFGGDSIYSTAEDFIKVLESLLRDDGKLISSASRKEMFAPQLSQAAKAALSEALASQTWWEDWNLGGTFPVGCERDHSLCGMFLCEDLPTELTPRRPGSISWTGMPNVHWLIDPTAGICTLYASQLEPTHDKPSKDLLRLFEKTMYERMHEAEGRES